MHLIGFFTHQRWDNLRWCSGDHVVIVDEYLDRAAIISIVQKWTSISSNLVNVILKAQPFPSSWVFPFCELLDSFSSNLTVNARYTEVIGSRKYILGALSTVSYYLHHGNSNNKAFLLRLSEFKHLKFLAQQLINETVTASPDWSYLLG